MLTQDQPVNVTSNRLVYKGRPAPTYTGNAMLWQEQDDRSRGHDPVDDKTGNLDRVRQRDDCVHVRGNRREDRGKPRRQTTGKADTFVYDDAKRLATYTGKAHINGPQGNVTGDKIELFLKPERSTSWNAPKPTAPRLGRRSARGSGSRTGDHLTYTAADEHYLMIGTPVELIEEKNGTCTLTVGHDGDVQPRNRQRAASMGSGTFPSTPSTLEACPPELKR